MYRGRGGSQLDPMDLVPPLPMRGRFFASIHRPESLAFGVSTVV